jgi:hypothetical protein
MWKDKIKRALDDSTFAQRKRRENQLRDITEWRANGSRVPTPHAVKSSRIRELGREFRCEVLIETGTCLGEMVVATLRDFKHIHSIELSALLAARARDRLATRPHVQVHEGDSAAMLPRVLAQISSRALIWLDAHYSGGLTARGAEDSPIAHEFAAIARYPCHVILIDDAQEFIGKGGYPTIDEMRDLSRQHFPSYKFDVKDHIIELLPPK